MAGRGRPPRAIAGRTYLALLLALLRLLSTSADVMKTREMNRHIRSRPDTTCHHSPGSRPASCQPGPLCDHPFPGPVNRAQRGLSAALDVLQVVYHRRVFPRPYTAEEPCDGG